MSTFQYPSFKRATGALSYLKPFDFAPYVISKQVVEESYREMAHKATVEDLSKDEAFGVMLRWDKPAYFQIEPSLGKADTDRDVVFYSVVLQRVTTTTKYKVTEIQYGGWSMAILSFVNSLEETDWTNRSAEINTMNAVYLRAVAFTMEGILDRPTEFVAAKNGRTRMQVLRNFPVSHTVTLSLSKPRKETVGHTNHRVSGIKMPRHRVREHLRHYKSGKVAVIHEHYRGDEHIERRTVTRVVP